MLRSLGGRFLQGGGESRTCATLRRRVAELHQDHRIRTKNVAVAPFSGKAAFYVVSERFQQDKG